jgi:hypothetical protein
MQDHAALVVDQTLEDVETWPGDVELPVWVDLRLTAKLMRRFGFKSHGGGACRVLTERGLLSLLADPKQLAQYLKRLPGGATDWRVTIEQLEKEPASRKPPPWASS